MTDFRALCTELADRLAWYIDEDETYRGDNSADGGTNWDEENAYWIQGQDKAIDALTRARAALAEPEPEEPTDAELMEIFADHDNGLEEIWPEDWPAAARDVLARWGGLRR